MDFFLRILDKIYFEFAGLKLTPRGERVIAILFIALFCAAMFTVGTIESQPLGGSQ